LPARCRRSIGRYAAGGKIYKIYEIS
jgi:hypothetical protein